MKKTQKFLTLLLVTAMLLAVMAVPAFAANPLEVPEQKLVVDENTENGTISVKKYLVVDRLAPIPAETFEFTIEPATVSEGMKYNGEKVLSGAGTIANPTATATFASTDTKTQGTPQSNNNGITTTGVNQAYATKDVTFSLAGVTFTAPGVYCYLIKETVGSTPSINYTLVQYYAMVFVGYKDNVVPIANASTRANAGSLAILGVNTVKATNEDGVYIYNNTSEKSTPQFVNKFLTDTLTISKTVTGNMGDRNKDFEFSLTITGNTQIPNGTELLAIKTYADGTTAANFLKVTVGTAYTFSLKHNEHLQVFGLPAGISYIVTETDYSGDSYTTSLISTENGSAGTSSEVRTITNAIVDGGNIESFTNNKNITTPTGILLEVWPYALVVLLAGVSAVLMISKKRRSFAK